MAQNPIHKLIQICNILQKPLDNGSKNFQPSALVITSIDVSNNTRNVIPSKAEMKFNVRFNDNFNSSSVIKLIHKRIKKITPKYKLSHVISGESFINSSGILTKTLIKITRDHGSNDEILNILNSKDRKKAGPTAPAHGLYLEKIIY